MYPETHPCTKKIAAANNRSLHSHSPPIHQAPGGNGGEGADLTSHSQKATFKVSEWDQEIAFNTSFCALTEQKKAAPPDRMDARTTTSAQPPQLSLKDSQHSCDWCARVATCPAETSCSNWPQTRRQVGGMFFMIPSRGGIKTHWQCECDGIKLLSVSSCQGQHPLGR